MIALWKPAKPGEGPGRAPRALPLPKIDVAITYLEMRHEPAWMAEPPTPAPAGADIAFVDVIQPTTAFYRFLYRTVGEPWLWWQRTAMGDADLRQLIEDPRLSVHVLMVGNQPAGFAELDRRRAPDLDLAYFGLMLPFIGRGFGRWFLERTIQRMWAEAPSRLTVNTCTLDHATALPNYKRAGFVPYHERRVQIDDPRAAGILPAHAGHGMQSPLGG